MNETIFLSMWGQKQKWPFIRFWSLVVWRWGFSAAFTWTCATAAGAAEPSLMMVSPAGSITALSEVETPRGCSKTCAQLLCDLWNSLLIIIIKTGATAAVISLCSATKTLHFPKSSAFLEFWHSAHFSDGWVSYIINFGCGSQLRKSQVKFDTMQIRHSIPLY